MVVWCGCVKVVVWRNYNVDVKVMVLVELW